MRSAGGRLISAYVGPIEESEKASHGRGPRFDPLCAHHLSLILNTLEAPLPDRVPLKSWGTMGAHGDILQAAENSE
jgi:hypothetical protein